MGEDLSHCLAIYTIVYVFHLRIQSLLLLICVFWQIVMEYCGGGSVVDVMNVTEEALEEYQIAYICREALKVLLFFFFTLENG